MTLFGKNKKSKKDLLRHAGTKKGYDYVGGMKGMNIRRMAWTRGPIAHKGGGKRHWGGKGAMQKKKKGAGGKKKTKRRGRTSFPSGRHRMGLTTSNYQ